MYTLTSAAVTNYDPVQEVWTSDQYNIAYDWGHPYVWITNTSSIFQVVLHCV